jgi:hypothetical protein
MQDLGAGHVEHSLVDGERLNLGVSASINRRTCFEAAEYFAKSGRMTTASGHARNALNIGMALLTPYTRAM